MIQYFKDTADGRIKAALHQFANYDVVLADVEEPTRPPMIVNPYHLFSETRFIKVASTAPMN